MLYWAGIAGEGMISLTDPGNRKPIFRNLDIFQLRDFERIMRDFNCFILLKKVPKIARKSRARFEFHAVFALNSQKYGKYS